MTDFLGKPLKVGDKVVVLQHFRTASFLVMDTVIGFTDEYVRIGRGLKSPEKLVKYEDAEAMTESD